MMDSAAVHRLQRAVELARQASHSGKLDDCDVGEVEEAIEAVRQELAQPHPNKNTLTLFLNSIARSLIAAPSAHDAREAIDHALRTAGLPANWEQ